MDEFVEVIDITITTTVPGLTLQHTVRAHEGDVLESQPGQPLLIRYGAKHVLIGGEKRKLAGKTVSILTPSVVEVTTSTRFEPRVRPSIAALVNKEKAEIDARLKEVLAQKPGPTTQSS